MNVIPKKAITRQKIIYTIEARFLMNFCCLKNCVCVINDGVDQQFVGTRRTFSTPSETRRTCKEKVDGRVLRLVDM